MLTQNTIIIYIQSCTCTCIISIYVHSGRCYSFKFVQECKVCIWLQLVYRHMKDFHFFCREFFLAKYKNSSQNEYHVSNCVPNSLIFGSFACLGIVADRGLKVFIKAYASLYSFCHRLSRDYIRGYIHILLDTPKFLLTFAKNIVWLYSEHSWCPMASDIYGHVFSSDA